MTRLPPLATLSVMELPKNGKRRWTEGDILPPSVTAQTVSSQSGPAAGKARDRDAQLAQFFGQYGDANDDRIGEVVDEILEEKRQPERFGLSLIVIPAVLLTAFSGVTLVMRDNPLVIAAVSTGGAIFSWRLASALSQSKRLRR